MADNSPNGDLSVADSVALMRRVADNNEQAIAELYDRFGKAVYKDAFIGAKGDIKKAEDWVGEAFVKVWRLSDTFNPDRNTLTVFVLRITRSHLATKLTPAEKRAILDAAEKVREN